MFSNFFVCSPFHLLWAKNLLLLNDFDELQEIEEEKMQLAKWNIFALIHHHRFFLFVCSIPINICAQAPAHF